MCPSSSSCGTSSGGTWEGGISRMIIIPNKNSDPLHMQGII